MPYLFVLMPDYGDCGKGILDQSLYLLFVDMLLMRPFCCLYMQG